MILKIKCTCTYLRVCGSIRDILYSPVLLSHQTVQLSMCQFQVDPTTHTSLEDWIYTKMHLLLLS